MLLQSVLQWNNFYRVMKFLSELSNKLLPSLYVKSSLVFQEFCIVFVLENATLNNIF